VANVSASAYTSDHTSPERGKRLILAQSALGSRFGCPEFPIHLVWGRVVPDIPAFCRELVAALAEE
jgi:hypothetical protein